MWIYIYIISTILVVLTLLYIGYIYYYTEKIEEIKQDPYEKLRVFIDENQERIENPDPHYILYDNPEIPMKIFQTWHSKVLPPYMKKCVDKLKQDNPEFNHFLFDDNDCRNFIKEYFDSDILNAFDYLKPGTYKADLWRYAILYIYGGIYLDIKYQSAYGFKFKYFLDKEYFVLERPSSIFWAPDSYGIYNAMMICKPKNPLLLNAIYKIAENVTKKVYGYSNLYPTGPGLLGSLYFESFSENIDKIYGFEFFFDNRARGILYQNKLVLQKYPEYWEEQRTSQKTEYYATLWKNRDIYIENENKTGTQSPL
jgi:hypothetical protein